jgi:hypothetical protein
MKTKVNRRDFITKSAVASIACCGLIFKTDFLAANSMNMFTNGTEIPDPKQLNYCGYQCSSDCQMLKATLENNLELKKEVYKNWKFKEKYGIEFDAEQVFCFKCKTTDKPLGISVKNCTVRQCAIKKGFDCCIECTELIECKKDLWDNFPDFKKAVIEMQKKYQLSKA